MILQWIYQVKKEQLVLQKNTGINFLSGSRKSDRVKLKKHLNKETVKVVEFTSS